MSTTLLGLEPLEIFSAAKAFEIWQWAGGRAEAKDLPRLEAIAAAGARHLVAGEGFCAGGADSSAPGTIDLDEDGSPEGYYFRHV